MRFVSAYSDIFFVEINVVESEGGEFTDADTALEEKFDNRGDAMVAAASIAEGAVFHFGENPGRGDFVFGVSDRSSWVFGDVALAFEESKEGFDGVDFAGNRFGGVIVFAKIFFEDFDVVGFDAFEGGRTVFLDAFDKLLDVFAVC